jgi:aspartyl-tRNA(Asn)/glutamyl-tRNA(Gln) amidotransferase subunit B
MNYDIVIGIETHIQLNTATKMFCSCSANSWQQEPNTHTCPVCLGLPGALPVINKAALDKAILMGLALHADIALSSKFDRKNYFYPDLAKGYQISQYEEPLCLGGYVEVDDRRIGLVRAHLEEDVGKLVHDGDETLVDFNKGGTPLLEIVSEPVLSSSGQAKAYVQALRQLCRYIGVNEGNLEQGTIRADINISLQDPGRWKYEEGAFVLDSGYVLHRRVEIKNLNSFRNIERAIDFEVSRQSHLLESGHEIEQETRGWDDVHGKTVSQRSKEEAHDYRYFPEPDLPPLVVDRAWVEHLSATLPELPAFKRRRFMDTYGLGEYDATLLTAEIAMAEWFEQATQQLVKGDPDSSRLSLKAKIVANWLLGEISRLQNSSGVLLLASHLSPDKLVDILQRIEAGSLSSTNAKSIVAECYIADLTVEQIMAQQGLASVPVAINLEPLAQALLERHADVVASIKAGKRSAIQFLVGQLLKETRGQARPDDVRAILERLLA